MAVGAPEIRLFLPFCPLPKDTLKKGLRREMRQGLHKGGVESERWDKSRKV